MLGFLFKRRGYDSVVPPKSFICRHGVKKCVDILDLKYKVDANGYASSFYNAYAYSGDSEVFMFFLNHEAEKPKQDVVILHKLKDEMIKQGLYEMSFCFRDGSYRDNSIT